MGNDDQQPDFKQWAVTGILFPFLCIAFLTLFIAPHLWGADLARKLGESLGRLFAVYLLCLAGVSIVWRASHRIRKSDRKRTNDD